MQATITRREMAKKIRDTLRVYMDNPEAEFMGLSRLSPERAERILSEAKQAAEIMLEYRAVENQYSTRDLTLYLLGAKQLPELDKAAERRRVADGLWIRLWRK